MADYDEQEGQEIMGLTPVPETRISELKKKTAKLMDPRVVDLTNVTDTDLRLIHLNNELRLRDEREEHRFDLLRRDMLQIKKEVHESSAKQSETNKKMSENQELMDGRVTENELFRMRVYSLANLIGIVAAIIVFLVQILPFLKSLVELLVKTP